MSKITFIDDNGTFVIRNPENYSGLYFPLAGEQGIKASITPNLGGDSKLDQNHFLLEPVSIENLHNNKNTRNFWCMIDGNGAWSVTGSSARQEYEKFTGQQDESELKAGFMWQELTRTSKEFGLQAVTSSFVSIDGSAEIMLVEIKNISDRPLTFTPIAAVPIYGRSADNIRDHRHVTSLLHRTQVTESGVYVKPTLSFDERGHQKNDTAYFVSGFDENGQYPADFYPTVESFIGEGGSFLNPEAVRIRKKGYRPGDTIDGKESVGAFAFEERALKPGETAGYIVVLGAVKEPDCRKAADKNAVIPET
ncbi:MAG: cellobiose phosphorylase, partial [Eubacteriales bacterium]|nr:cellobiose phosphorylase [Eubacteriales bacterium]